MDEKHQKVAAELEALKETKGSSVVPAAPAASADSASVQEQVKALTPSIFKAFEEAHKDWLAKQEATVASLKGEVDELRGSRDRHSAALAATAITKGSTEREPTTAESGNVEARLWSIESRLTDLQQELALITEKQNQDRLEQRGARQSTLSAGDQPKKSIASAGDFMFAATEREPSVKQVVSIEKDASLESLNETHIDAIDGSETEHEMGESMWESCLLVCFGHSIGRDCAVIILLGAIVNLAVQFVFTLVVYANLADPTIQESTVDAIKHWRGIEGHAFKNVNPISGTTLVAQLCAGDDALPLSASQFDMYSDLSDFLVPQKQAVQDMGLTWINGRLLNYIALLLWLMSIVQDMIDNAKFCMVI